MPTYCSVVAWIESVADAELHLASVTIGEIQAGIECTCEQDSAKAGEIERWLDQVCTTFNILTLDGPAHGGHPQRGRLQPL